MKNIFLLLMFFEVTFFHSVLVKATECKIHLSDQKMIFKNKISLHGTFDNGELAEEILPRGSALLTSSGALSRSQITAVIHAASGSMMRSGDHYEPTLDSIRSSVFNSVVLAEANEYESLVIPMIGGGIFLNRIGIRIEALALAIIQSAVEARTSLNSKMRLVFIGVGDSDSGAFQQAFNEFQNSNTDLSFVSVVKGSILDFKDHGSKVIVNAANTEVVFGGGLSGVIGRATENARAIEVEAKQLILDLAERK